MRTTLLSISAILFGGIGAGFGATEDRSIEPVATAPRQAATEPRALTERGLENIAAAAKLLSYLRFFGASDQAVGVASWDHVAVELCERVEPAPDAAALAQALLETLEPIAPHLQVWAGAPDHAPPLPPIPHEAKPKGIAWWRHLGAGRINPAGKAGNIYSSRIERQPVPDQIVSEEHRSHFRRRQLAGGVSCRVPVRVYYNNAGTIPPGTTPAKWATAATRPPLTSANRETRLAGVASAWGIFQHFYPYFDVVKADWGAALIDGLKQAAVAKDDLEYLHALRELVAKLHDGHGRVQDPSLQVSSHFPLALEWAGADLVVVGQAASVPPDVAFGDVVVSIDGRSANDCYSEVSKWISAATEGWRRARSSLSLLTDLPTADPAVVLLRRPNGQTYTTQLARSVALPMNKATSKRPAAGAEVSPGVVYFNLVAADSAALKSGMNALNAAKGIVFDLRGYPNRAAYEVIQHLIDSPAQSARWNVPIVTLPDQEGVTWNESGRWTMPPLSPRWKQPVAFMTDGRAISYAESIMGIIEHYKLGEIVGAPTAGTNGNVNPFTLPGDFRIGWTGMKVLKHDGSRHHGVGNLPTVPAAPTAKGIAEGRDEVLERAIEVVKAKIGARNSQQ